MKKNIFFILKIRRHWGRGLRPFAAAKRW